MATALVPLTSVTLCMLESLIQVPLFATSWDSQQVSTLNNKIKHYLDMHAETCFLKKKIKKRILRGFCEC